MKKKSSPDHNDELLPEYGAELFRNMKPGRFAGVDLQLKGRRAIVLDEDVAEVFDQETANVVLRSAIKAMRTAAAPKKIGTAAKTVRASRRAS